MPDPRPSPTVDEFLATEQTDRNAWWRLDSGDHLNLFDEAVEQRDAAVAERDALRPVAEAARDLLLRGPIDGPAPWLARLEVAVRALDGEHP